MKRWPWLWEQANRIALCRCGSEPAVTTRFIDPIVDWALENEFWNGQLPGHLLVASLILDGAPVEAIP